MCEGSCCADTNTKNTSIGINLVLTCYLSIVFCGFLATEGKKERKTEHCFSCWFHMGFESEIRCSAHIHLAGMAVGWEERSGVNTCVAGSSAQPLCLLSITAGQQPLRSGVALSLNV